MRPDAAFDLADARVVAGLVAFLVAWRTKDLPLTTALGLTLVTVLEQIG